MMDTDILEMLENIGRSSVARLTPAVILEGDGAPDRRSAVLRTIRGTVLPRRLEFTAANGDCLAIEVTSSRVTDVFKVQSGRIPDFETEPRDDLAGQLAQLVSDIASSPAPLELVSLKPDTTLEADDVGITLGEIETACANIDLPADPIVAVVSDQEQAPAEDPVADPESAGAETLATRFFEASEPFALGRVLAASKDGSPLRSDGDCARSGSLHPDQDVLRQFAQDLAGWSSDVSADPDQPQLIVMRPSGGKGPGLAVLHHGDEFGLAVHDARKLGVVVNLWTSLREAQK